MCVCVCVCLCCRILDLLAEDNGIEDTLYYLGEGLRRDTIELDVFLKVSQTQCRHNACSCMPCHNHNHSHTLHTLHSRIELIMSRELYHPRRWGQDINALSQLLAYCTPSIL